MHVCFIVNARSVLCKLQDLLYSQLEDRVMFVPNFKESFALFSTRINTSHTIIVIPVVNRVSAHGIFFLYHAG